jgi:hypothetical protein
VVDTLCGANGGDTKPLNAAAAPAAPPRALETPLGLPHPTVHATLCAELWDQATSSPDRTARKVRVRSAPQRQCQWATACGCQPSDGVQPALGLGVSRRQRAFPLSRHRRGHRQAVSFVVESRFRVDSHVAGTTFTLHRFWAFSTRYWATCAPTT